MAGLVSARPAVKLSAVASLPACPVDLGLLLLHPDVLLNTDLLLHPDLLHLPLPPTPPQFHQQGGQEGSTVSTWAVQSVPGQ